MHDRRIIVEDYGSHIKRKILKIALLWGLPILFLVIFIGLKRWDLAFVCILILVIAYYLPKAYKEEYPRNR